MTEFNDDVSKRWMTSFHNFDTKGFSDEFDWRHYIEEMIKTDKHPINVLMKPPPVFIKSRNLSPTADIRVQYSVNIGEITTNFVIIDI